MYKCIKLPIKKDFAAQYFQLTFLIPPCECNYFKVKLTQALLASYLSLSQVAQSEVKSSQVVEDLRGDISLHLLLQDAGGCAVGGQCSLDVSLLQDLSQLDPCLHIVWVLLGYLLQMTLTEQKQYQL